MTTQEKSLWLRLYQTGRAEIESTDIREVRYLEKGPYTCCLINGGERVGFAKCNPNYDTPDRTRGRAISFARALR